ncbi:hypothetical protein OHB53_30595 [Streptomyces sp. NBC_00056]|uniref:hypothetical protein n=1 Tax=unclassified Streptomyces TaxID=2593676 RepID=UPI00225363F0|nr:hypothetical protein [Streptomyces sp. NBC_00063]MCX5437273.1 hypothetical protein [Streptomyces sp. NBC_00063]
MSENSATRAPDPGRIEATEPSSPLAARRSPLAARRSPLAAMTSAREIGESLAAELGAMFHQITDRSRPTTPG